MPDVTTQPVTPDPTPAVQWYKSQRFTSILQVSTILVLTWLGNAIATNIWDWHPLAALAIANVLALLNDWRSPTITAPIAAMNKANVKP